MSGAATSSRALSSGGDIRLQSEGPRSLAQRIRDRIEKSPDGIVRSYRDDGRHHTQGHAALWRRSGDVAAALAAAGAQPSTLVVILADDILDFLPAFWACLRGGFVAVPLMGAAKEAIYRNDAAFDSTLSLLKDCFVLADDGFIGLAEHRFKERPDNVISLSSVVSAIPWIDREVTTDPACLVATSGSTGNLKLVELSNSALIFRNYARSNPGDSHALIISPLYTVTGQAAICLHAASTTQLSARSMAIRPTVVLDAIEEFGITHLGMTATMIGRILGGETDSGRMRNLASLQVVGIGGEPIAIRFVQDFAQLLHRHGARPNVLGSGYGTTETGTLSNGSKDFLKVGPLNPVCLGPPRAGVQMRIVGEDRSVLGPGEIGELEVSCPQKMFSRYWGDPDLTRHAFAPDGWWKTGDLGQLLDNQLYLHGRAKEVLIVAGRKFSLADIDQEMQNSLLAGDVAHAFSFSRPGEPEELGVVFAVSEPSRANGLADKIRMATLRRFGILPRRIFQTERDLIPRNAAGKLRRGHLNLLLDRDETGQSGSGLNGPGGLQACRDALETTWNDALGTKGPVAPRTNFFDCGGDSLRSLSLHHQISEALGVSILADEFFSDPTFEALVTLVKNRRSAPEPIDSRPAVAWPLPPALHNELLIALETWAGERPTKSRTVLAFNRQGTKPPLFWIFNASHEVGKLAKALGDDQPLYAFRSGWLVTDYREDDIQAFALRYLSEIIELCPEGPFFIGGNCQGGVIALAIANHALRRKRHVPFIVLMDWTFALQPHQGHVLLVSGRDNFDYNPVRRFERPELAWRRAFASYEFVEIPGGYAQGFEDGLIEVLTDVLTSRMQSALQNPPIMLPETGYRASVTVHEVPPTMETSSCLTLQVVVTQDSSVDWNSTEQSGIVVGSRWLDANSRILQRSSLIAGLPQMPQHSSVTVDLAITAPDTAGEFTLNVELREEVNKWFHKPEAGFLAPISIVVK